MENRYELDPDSIDNRDAPDFDNYVRDIPVTLDTWKPSPPKRTLIQSQWRKNQINGNSNQDVSFDEFNKIKSAIKKKFPDHEIMEAYGINAETLIAIKENRIDPLIGKTKGKLNSLPDDNEFILKRLRSIDDKFYGMNLAFKELAKILFECEDTQKIFLKLLSKEKPKEKRIKDDIEE